MELGLLVITNGRQEYIKQTIISLKEHFDIDRFAYKIIVDDSGDINYSTWLTDTYPDFDIQSHEINKGLSGSINTGWKSLEGKVDYIFHLEEDFTFNVDIPVDQMLLILLSNPDLSQIALLRQPWNESESAAGGIVEQNHSLYSDKKTAGLNWLEHSNLFTLNPCMYSKNIISNGWPDGGGEREFSDILLSNGKKFGFFGKRGATPLVHHIGAHRAGGWKL